MHPWLELARKTLQSFMDDDCPDRAAIISYYALFSLFPLILGLIAVATFLLEAATVQARILDFVAQIIPGSEDLVSSNIQNVLASRGTIGVISIVSLLWSATGVFSAIRRSLNQAWGVERERPLIQQKLIEFGMIAGVGVLVAASVAATAIFDLVWQALPPGLQFVGGIGKNAAATLLPVFLSYVSFVVLYRFVPNTRVTLGEIWLGAIVATVLFEGAKSLFTWYLTHFANYSIVYGTVGAAIALLFWAYVSAAILLLGAELSAEHSRLIESQNHRKLARQIAGRQPTSTDGDGRAK